MMSENYEVVDGVVLGCIQKSALVCLQQVQQENCHLKDNISDIVGTELQHKIP